MRARVTSAGAGSAQLVEGHEPHLVAVPNRGVGQRTRQTRDLEALSVPVSSAAAEVNGARHVQNRLQAEPLAPETP